MIVNIYEAKTQLSKLLQILSNKDEEEIIIAKYGKPFAKLSLFSESDKHKRVGIAKNKMDSISLDEFNNIDVFGDALGEDL